MRLESPNRKRNQTPRYHV